LNPYCFALQSSSLPEVFTPDASPSKTLLVLAILTGAKTIILPAFIEFIDDIEYMRWWWVGSLRKKCRGWLHIIRRSMKGA
jgi:hypothetical protein